MQICFCRVDERLLHGQVTITWVKDLSISHIFVVDDALANDKMAIKVMSMMISPRIDLRILSLEQMVGIYRENRTELSNKRIMLLFRSLSEADRFLSQAGHAFDALNLGSISYRIGRQRLDKNLFLSMEERLIIQKMIQQEHIRVYSQILPGDTPIDLSTLK